MTGPKFDSPPPLLRAAGLLAMLVIIFVDAWADRWNPNPWLYLLGIALIVWGPVVLRR